MAQYVKLGPKANFFRAASIDLSIAPGEVVALNARQMSNRLVKRALHGGHLVITQKEDTTVPVEEKLSLEELKDSFVQMVEAGDDVKKIAKTFSREDLVDIAKEFDIVVEPADKKSDIVTAIMDDLNDSEEIEGE